MGFWGFGVLGFWGFGVLGFWGFGVLGFWGFGVLGKWLRIGKGVKDMLADDLSVVISYAEGEQFMGIGYPDILLSAMQIIKYLIQIIADCISIDVVYIYIYIYVISYVVYNTKCQIRSN